MTAFQRHALYVIAGLDDPHGLTIREELEEDYNKTVHHGRLYLNLDTLVNKGLVNKGKYDNRTNYYRLTEEGKRELAVRRERENQYVSFE